MLYGQGAGQRSLQKKLNRCRVIASIGQNQPKVFQIKETPLFEAMEKFEGSLRNVYDGASILEEPKIMPERPQW